MSRVGFGQRFASYGALGLPQSVRDGGGTDA
jgi:hypothetical protein